MDNSAPGTHHTPVAFHSDDEQQTQSLAAELARQLPGGTVLALDGTLGAGKTRFVQGLAQGLHIPVEEVVSPTFVIHQVHRGDRTLHHFDVYRLTGPDEFWDLGVEEYLGGDDTICVIEWAARVAAALPARRLQVDLALLDENRRRIEITPIGPGWDDLRPWLVAHPLAIPPSTSG